VAFTFRGFVEESLIICLAFLFAAPASEALPRLLVFTSRSKQFISIDWPRELLKASCERPKDTSAEGKVHNPVDSDERRF
jgi:hypothetical protein